MQRRITNIYYSADQFDWIKTKAFRYKIGMAEGIVINRKERQTSGTVDEEEYENLRNEIIEKLKNINDKKKGKSVITEVYKREEIYKGKFVDLVPDIIFMLSSKYKGGVGINKNNFIESIPDEAIDAISGVHDMDGILILSGPKLKKKYEMQPVDMVDIFPTVLYDLGIPIPSYIDGKTIKDAFLDEYASLPIKYIESPLFEDEKILNLSAEEEEEMKKALKGLGYLS